MPILGFGVFQGGIERDGVNFAIKGEKAKEAEKKLRKWLQKIKLVKEEP